MENQLWVLAYDQSESSFEKMEELLKDEYFTDRSKLNIKR